VRGAVRGQQGDEVARVPDGALHEDVARGGHALALARGGGPLVPVRAGAGEHREQEPQDGRDRPGGRTFHGKGLYRKESPFSTELAVQFSSFPMRLQRTPLFSLSHEK